MKYYVIKNDKKYLDVNGDWQDFMLMGVVTSELDYANKLAEQYEAKVYELIEKEVK